ncbi:MAG: hypothetical protein GWN81_16640 [Phycisphaerae bacterium]|nr:hypothetical protein [Phycisphaerae bacterium]NIP54029.1 hypothetical protein [Phycisphaerae bacterium]NIU10440.1 hypothetical protein [Phycisphaerae bacterium]NIX27363.1 hypothetical protein [Phycisphaerae bacterium]
MKTYLEKIPSLGAIIAAAGCPICFPALAAVGSVLGLGALAAYENQLLIITQILVAFSLIFSVVSHRRTRFKSSFVLAIGSGVLFFGSWYFMFNQVVIYIALAGIFVSAIWNTVVEKRVRDGINQRS